MTITLQPGDAVTNSQEFNTLPLGTTLRDGDGWIHTKISDFVEPGGGEDTTSYVQPDGTTGTFRRCWTYGPTRIVSIPHVEQTSGFAVGDLLRFINFDEVRSADLLILDGAGETLYAYTGAETLEVIETRVDGTSESVRIRVLGSDHVDGDWWSTQVNQGDKSFPRFAKIECPATTTPARPTIDFSLDRYKTLVAYAGDLWSRAHKEQTNVVLAKIRSAETVDVYDILDVLPDVFSVCATRAGQSLGRREFTKQARALAYPVLAVIRNHADGLPTYEQGERSPALRDANERVRLLEERIENLLLGVATATEQVEVITAERDQWAIKANEEVEKNHRDLQRATRQAAEILRLRATLDYMLSLSSDDVKFKAVGYRDALDRL